MQTRCAGDIVLTEEIRKKATIDWTIKESVRAGLRVAVKDCSAVTVTA